MTKILIASNNPGKLVEIQALLGSDTTLTGAQGTTLTGAQGTTLTGVQGGSLGALELLLPRQLGLALDVVEDGLTYADNAALKAMAYYRATRPFSDEALIILGDDSGLEVDALGGEPGLHSARYSTRPGATDADRRAFLLQNLAACATPRPWLAHFHCTVALVSPSGILEFAEGDCPGEIIPDERGSNGFGYDPIFLLSQLGRTMAELTMDEKNQLSHRALAVKAAFPILKRWIV